MTGLTGTTLTLGVISGWVYAMAVLFIVVSLFMMLVILIQKPKGGGLGGAFGGGAGAGSQQAVFGAKAGDALTWFTIVSFVLFLMIAMGLTWAINPEVEEEEQAQAVPPASAGLGAPAGDAAAPPTDVAGGDAPLIEVPPATAPADSGGDSTGGFDLLTEPLLPGIEPESGSEPDAEPDAATPGADLLGGQ
ncbi:MAG: preprotein translocase subunit SecG [Planctomycetota bacterium]